jgi:hypothetical protein
MIYTVTTVARRPTFRASFLGNFCVTFVPAFPVRFPVNQDRAFNTAGGAHGSTM